MMSDRDEFRRRCESLFRNIVETATGVESWRLLARSSTQGGPTFEVRFLDGSVRRRVVPDFHIVTGVSDDEIVADFRDFLQQSTE
jgi:hypothetical protein